MQWTETGCCGWDALCGSNWCSSLKTPTYRQVPGTLFLLSTTHWQQIHDYAMFCVHQDVCKLILSLHCIADELNFFCQIRILDSSLQKHDMKVSDCWSQAVAVQGSTAFHQPQDYSSKKVWFLYHWCKISTKASQRVTRGTLPLLIKVKTNLAPQ